MALDGYGAPVASTMTWAMAAATMALVALPGPIIYRTQFCHSSPNHVVNRGF